MPRRVLHGGHVGDVDSQPGGDRIGSGERAVTHPSSVSPSVVGSDVTRRVFVSSFHSFRVRVKTVLVGTRQNRNAEMRQSVRMRQTGRG